MLTEEQLHQMYIESYWQLVDFLWQKRNSIIFKNKGNSIEAIIRQCIQDFYGRSSMYPRLATYMQKFNYSS